jgi:hypothetical protein
VSDDKEGAMDEVEIEPPHVHHHKTGYAWLDKVLPVSALFVSFLSILMSAHHGEVMKELVHQNERLVQANSLPHLTLETGEEVREKGDQHIRFRVTNGGVGPAEIRTAELLLDGRALSGSRQLLRECCGIDSSEYYWLPLMGRMLRPGQTAEYLHLNTRPQTAAGMPKLAAAVNQKRIVTRLCYCSVFDECWVRTSAEGSRPEPVKECPAPKLAYTH